MQKPILTIVGLGSGDLKSLSPSGFAAIKAADLIVYEYGLSAEVLSLFSSRGHCLPSSRLSKSEEKEIPTKTATYVEELREGKTVVRLSLDHAALKNILASELKLFKTQGLSIRYLPSLHTLQKVAWDLGLPWLSIHVPSSFRVIQSTEVTKDLKFWQQLAGTTATLAVDVGPHRLLSIVDRLLKAGADPNNPAALVAHHPTQNPVCWLTTLGEMDELLPAWKPTGATTVYIGKWLHQLPAVVIDENLWGRIQREAEAWLESQRA